MIVIVVSKHHRCYWTVIEFYTINQLCKRGMISNNINIGINIGANIAHFADALPISKLIKQLNNINPIINTTPF